MTSHQLLKPKEAWYVWTPDVADDDRFADVAAAVEAFESIPTPAGETESYWLRRESLWSYPSTITRVLVRDGLVQGYYSLTGSTVRLTNRHLRALPLPMANPNPLQPATLISHLAKHRHATITADTILMHAVGVALEVAQLQGSVALVVEPHDETSAELFTRRGFRRSGRSASETTPRLWVPLHLDADRSRR